MKRIFLVPVLSLFLITVFSFFAPDKNGKLVQEVFLETNEFRKSQHLPSLIIKPSLNAIAQKHSENMASGKVGFGHDGAENRSEQINKSMKTEVAFGENVAFGPTSGAAVLGIWKDSPGHRSNILGKYKYIGIGVATNKNGLIYYTQIFAG